MSGKDGRREPVDRRLLLFLFGAVASIAMYPVVAPLDTADPAKPQHFGAVAIGVSVTYVVLMILSALDGRSRRAGRRRTSTSGGAARTRIVRRATRPCSTSA